MKENNIVSRQLAFLVFGIMLGTAIIYVPESITGRDSWLATLFGTLVGLFILYMVITLQNMFSGSSILQISKAVLGIIPGTVLNVFYLSTLFLITLLYLNDLVLFLSLIMPNTSHLLIKSLIVMTAVYISYQGITALARLGDLMGYVILVLAIIVIAIPTFSIDWSNFLPLLIDWRPVVAGTFIAVQWPFGEIIIIALYLPLVTDLKKNARTIYNWYGMAAVIMIIRTIVVMGVLGPELIPIMRFPLFHILRTIALAGFQRIELLFFFFWFLIGFVGFNIFFTGFVYGLKEFLKFRSQTSLILPIALLIIVMCTYLFPSDIGFSQISTSLGFIILPVVLLYPTIIFFAARLRGKSISSNSSRPEELNNS